MKWQELTAPETGVRLHVRRVVEPEAKPMLLLHGLGVAGAVWQSFARRLLPDFAAVAPDLRGHGKSDAPPQGYEPHDYAADLAKMISEQRLAPLPVVGHSLGALVALTLADQSPELVSWLVLLDPPLDPQQRNWDIPRVYRLRHAPPSELESSLLEANPGGGELLARALAKMFRQASDAAFEAMLEQDHRTPALEQARRLQQRCLVLQADPERGGVLGDDAAREFVNELRHGKLLKIEGAPHAMHASHPAEVAQAIVNFERA
jgi:pimeloyl-ACP methyl ester carboxylesterase